MTWCMIHTCWDDCGDYPKPFDHLDDVTERTIVGVPPAPPTDVEIDARDAGDGIDTSGIPEMDAAVLEFEYTPTQRVEDFAAVAEDMDAAAAPPDPVLEAQKKTLGAVFEAMLAAGVPAGTCNQILFSAVEKLGLGPK